MDYLLRSPKSMKPTVSINALPFVPCGSMSILFGSFIVAVFFEEIPVVHLTALRPQCFRTHLNLYISAGVV